MEAITVHHFTNLNFRKTRPPIKLPTAAQLGTDHSRWLETSRVELSAANRIRFVQLCHGAVRRDFRSVSRETHENWTSPLETVKL